MANKKNRINRWLIFFLIVGIIVALTVLTILFKNMDISDDFDQPWWKWVLLFLAIYFVVRFLFFAKKKETTETAETSISKLRAFWEKNKPKVSWRWLPLTLLILLFLAGIFFLTPAFRSWFTPDNENSSVRSSNGQTSPSTPLLIGGEKNIMTKGEWKRFTIVQGGPVLQFEHQDNGEVIYRFEKVSNRSVQWEVKAWKTKRGKLKEKPLTPPPYDNALCGEWLVCVNRNAIVKVLVLQE